MKVVEGFVCLARQPEPVSQERMFGQNNGGGQDRWEAFATNDLSTFTNLDEARIAKSELDQRRRSAGFTRVSLGQISILVWDLKEILEMDDREMKELQASRSLVVIAKDPDFKGLPGSLLEMNGFKCFNRFDSAVYCAKQIDRQMQHPTLIGTFNLKRISR